MSPGRFIGDWVTPAALAVPALEYRSTDAYYLHVKAKSITHIHLKLLFLQLNLFLYIRIFQCIRIWKVVHSIRCKVRRDEFHLFTYVNFIHEQAILTDMLERFTSFHSHFLLAVVHLHVNLLYPPIKYAISPLQGVWGNTATAVKRDIFLTLCILSVNFIYRHRILAISSPPGLSCQ